MSSQPYPARHRPVYILLVVLLLSAVLVPIIALQYAYGDFSWTAAGVGFAVLLAAMGAAWLLTRTTGQGEAPTDLDRITPLGLVLGLVWGRSEGCWTHHLPGVGFKGCGPQKSL